MWRVTRSPPVQCLPTRGGSGVRHACRAGLGENVLGRYLRFEGAWLTDETTIPRRAQKEMDRRSMRTKETRNERRVRCPRGASAFRCVYAAVRVSPARLRLRSVSPAARAVPGQAAARRAEPSGKGEGERRLEKMRMIQQEVRGGPRVAARNLVEARLKL